MTDAARTPPLGKPWGRQPGAAVGVMARAPSSGGKSRLAPHLSAPRLAALRTALVADTLREADRLDITGCQIRSGYDIDTIEDLRRLERDLAGASPEIAPHVRGWFSEGS